MYLLALFSVAWISFRRSIRPCLDPRGTGCSPCVSLTSVERKVRWDVDKVMPAVSCLRSYVCNRYLWIPSERFRYSMLRPIAAACSFAFCVTLPQLVLRWSLTILVHKISVISSSNIVTVIAISTA
ncbi:hypothetical protein BDR07DRAFT_467371 [Suillus spraguei]|nr:hypothetical protein BDR07DRAFT_467371 [Suillus spraguei]